MSRLRFVKPSPWRAFWRVVLATFIVYVMWIIVICILASITDENPISSTNNRDVFLAWDALFAAPIYALMFWFVSAPLVVALGGFFCSLRRRESSEPTPLER